MYILSQDKTRIYNMSGHIEGIGYEESKDYKQRKSENIRHLITICLVKNCHIKHSLSWGGT